MEKLTGALTSLFPHKDHLFVCFTGGGGKTGSLELLGSYYRSLGKSVLLTTTTKFQGPSFYRWNADRVFDREEELLNYMDKNEGKPCTVVFGLPYSDKKLCSPPLDVLRRLKDRFSVILCEADGSRNLPFKIHTHRDPVIPDFSDFTVALIGARGALKPLKECVFGYEGEEEGISDTEFVNALINMKEGLFKGTEKGKRAVLINAADAATEEQANVFLNATWPSDCVIILGSVHTDNVFKQINRK
ncbi:MAG: putative selenium-dependent hydroxylase accessory protein YqeC [Sphaerochaetaceae bacterium]|nr:putative selenium-dependent hydroxylase accessory protein YqeC [Sphaerochaetaceae bacterium]